MAELAKTGWPRIGLRGPVALATIAGLGFGGHCRANLRARPPLPATPPTIVVMPIVDARNDRDVAAMAADVTERLIDGLAGSRMSAWWRHGRSQRVLPPKRHRRRRRRLRRNRGTG